MTNLERYVLGVPAEMLFQHFYCHGCDNCPAQQLCNDQPAGTCCRENFLVWAECDTLPNNKPLTLKELRGMDGQPVWIAEYDMCAIVGVGHGKKPFLYGVYGGDIQFCYDPKKRKLNVYRCTPEKGE